MIKQISLKFLTELKINNSKEWLEQNNGLYQAYSDGIVQFTEKLSTKVICASGRNTLKLLK
jgi:Conserved hypothetical protein (DUF2461)